MFSALAEVYDLFSDDIDYELWAKDISDKVKKYTCDAKTIIDLACGTGNITMRLAKKGYSVTGIDISQDMLLKAGENFRKAGVKIPLSQQDISDFKIHKRADAVCCVCDGVNYLTKEKQLNGFFAGCRRALKNGGILVFDISSEEKLKDILGNNDYFDIRDNACLFWENEINGNFIDIRLNIFIKENDGRYLRLCEEQRQRIYTKNEIISELDGFELLEVNEICYDKNNSDKRLQFICRLEEEL